MYEPIDSFISLSCLILKRIYKTLEYITFLRFSCLSCLSFLHDRGRGGVVHGERGVRRGCAGCAFFQGRGRKA